MARIMVSGASGGIGSALVRALRQRDDEVIALGRDGARLAALDAQPVVLDLAAPESVAPALRSTGAERLDALVHAAGVAEFADVGSSTPESWARQLAVNLTGPAELTRTALPALRRAAGQVVFLNFWAGPTAKPHWAAYAASKFGLGALADALRAEEAAHGVRVTSVFPSCVATPLQRRLREGAGVEYRPGHLNQPEEVAELILTALDASPRTRVNELYLGLPPEGYPPGTPGS
ncbi:SDR family oxidoreductase [Streptomyces sp. AJS327]|uniref:SDR family oxidoreductase n=1 Tax=Streptomyces sp. AJS327 TaxID=2545265 RepID=UPI0015DF57C4|nr:SDR family oxidoreductase [Streptomyces sp. AJS327]MBA0053030.1 SDR family oxidoreductase [Streptomyces sp. AJS327]